MASIRTTFKLEGLAELDVALKELPKATARNVLLRVGKKNMQPVADAGEAMAPVRTGWLAESYQVSTQISRRQRAQARRESSVEVYVGPGASARSIQTEFGNAHQAPQPHLRPAWDGSVGLVLENVTKDLAEEIEKARKRLARKAEREAAKMRA